MINVTQYTRKPSSRSHSIERIFEDVRAYIPSDIQVKVCQNKFISKGFLPRICDMFRARLHQGHVNHVTGDIHFINYLLDKKRTILTIHDFITVERLRGLKRWILWLLWYWLPEKRCAVITVVSETTRQQVFRHLRCDKSKVKVIYNNVSDEFQPSPKPFDAHNPRILQIGTNPNKNIHRVAQALTGVPCTLVVIGHLSKEQIAILKRFNIAYENHFSLSRQDLLEQYKACDILVFASTYEGFGLPIIEGNAVGRPVVTSNCWSMPEIGRDAACYVDPFNPDSIRKGILRVIKDVKFRDSIVQSGFINARRFHITNISAQYAELYRLVYSQARHKYS